MNFTYIYDGFLSQDTLGSIARTGRTSPFFVEVKAGFHDEAWARFLKFSDEQLPKYPFMRETGGGWVQDTTAGWACINPDFKIKFMAFRTKADKELFMKEFAEYVFTGTPFRSAFSTEVGLG